MAKLPKDHVYHVYTMSINEGQRRIIQKALQAAEIQKYGVFDSEPGSGCGAEDNEVAEYLLLQSMILDLPNQEAESPGVIHGLAY